MSLRLIQCGVIGAGRFGKHYVRLLQEIEGIKLRAVADSSPKALEAIAAASIKKTNRWQEVLDDPEIDCVVIAVPVSQHFSLTKAALESGKHVLVEKPMVRTLEEAEQLADAVRYSGRIFMVGHQYLYNDYLNYLKNEIDKGTFGKIFYVLAEHFYPGPMRDDVGCFWETATHELAIIDYFFGPQKILESVGRSLDFNGDSRDDFTSAEILFSNKVNATITVSWLAPEKIRRFTLVGERGAAVFDERKEEQLKFYFPVPGRFSFQDAKIIIPVVYAKEPLQNQLEHFRNCIREEKIPRTGIEHGVRVTEMLDMISKSLRTN